ncbi:uncharacterized protein RB166_016888 [Leptodactylus fuscus]
MANVSVYALGPSPSPGDAQGNVYLLAVDSISDLHSVPLDTETPQGAGVTSEAHDEKSASDKPPAPSAELPPQRSRRGVPWTTALLTLLIVIALINMSLVLYILQLYRHQDVLLRTLADRCDAPAQSLQKSFTN